MSLVQDARGCAKDCNIFLPGMGDRRDESPAFCTNQVSGASQPPETACLWRRLDSFGNRGVLSELFVAFVSSPACALFGTVGCDTDAGGLGFVRAGPPVMREPHRERSMKVLFLIACIFIQGVAVAQADENVDLRYTYAEFRFVDIDNRAGDGLQLNGSFKLTGNWILVGGVTAVSLNNNVDSTLVELGGGYVIPLRARMDLVSTLRYVGGESDVPGGGRVDDNGFGISTGLRSRTDSKFEFRGLVNHINMEHDQDTHIELAGDYFITSNIAAGASVKFAGDADSITIGARWFFE